MDGWDVVRFLCHLLPHIPGKLLILWDGASIHRGEAVRKLLVYWTPEIGPLDKTAFIP